MKKGTERIYRGGLLTIYHQNIPKKQLAAHAHHEAHLFIPLEGTIELTVKGNVHKVPAGQMIFISGSLEHSFVANNQSGERLIIQFLEPRQYRPFQHQAIILPSKSLLRSLTLELFPHRDSSFAKSLEGLLLEILQDSLAGQLDGGGNALFVVKEKILGTKNPQVSRVISVMGNDLELSLDQIAQKAGTSPRSLARTIKSELGLSPKDLYTFFRIQKACELIFKGELGLTAIAFECGYASLSQFITNFKKWTGQKPSEFRPSH